MRLRTLVPPLPTELLGNLEELGIKTDSDLLFSDSGLVYQKLLPTTISLHDFNQIISDVAERAAAPALHLNHPLTHQNREGIQDPELESGVPELDALLHGFGGSRVIEFSGDKGSGKTVRSPAIDLLTWIQDISCLLGACYSNSPSPSGNVSPRRRVLGRHHWGFFRGWDLCHPLFL
jgi:RAD51-like protein 3